jgi:hypothetical protein
MNIFCAVFTISLPFLRGNNVPFESDSLSEINISESIKVKPINYFYNNKIFIH